VKKLSFEANSLLKSLSDGERRQLRFARSDKQLRNFLIVEFRRRYLAKHKDLAALFGISRASVERALAASKVKRDRGFGLEDLRNEFKFFAENFLHQLDELRKKVS